MNEILERMIAFRSALSAFSEVLARSGQREGAAEQNLAQYWDDDFARRFRAQYEELSLPVLEFRHQADSTLLPFIDAKIHEIRRYLDHA
jgi:hypothetical protein